MKDEKAFLGQPQRTGKTSGINGPVIGIILATFLSDVSHEMATAMLPLPEPEDRRGIWKTKCWRPWVMMAEQ